MLISALAHALILSVRFSTGLSRQQARGVLELDTFVFKGAGSEKGSFKRATAKKLCLRKKLSRDNLIKIPSKAKATCSEKTDKGAKERKVLSSKGKFNSFSSGKLIGSKGKNVFRNLERSKLKVGRVSNCSGRLAFSQSGQSEIRSAECAKGAEVPKFSSQLSQNKRRKERSQKAYFVKLILLQIKKNKFYPPIARYYGLQDEVVVRLTINRGKLVGEKILRCKYRIFSTAVSRILDKCDFRKIQGNVTAVVKIEFKLKD